MILDFLCMHPFAADDVIIRTKLEKTSKVEGLALIQFDGDKEYERVQNIQKHVTSCNERYVGMNARVIPEIPKCLDIGYVEKHYAQANTNDELMIGLDYETIEPLSMNLNENDMIVLSGKKDVSRKAFAKYIISVFADKKFGKTELYVLDTLAGKWGELEILPQTAYYTTDADSSISIVTEIGQIVEQRYQNYINRRSNLQDESWIVVIVDNNDAILALSSNKNANHYGYCWNNPVDFVDRDGNLPTVVIGAVIGLAAGALGEVVSQTIDGVQSGKSVLDSLLDVNPGKVVLEAGKGAVTGAVAGTGAGLLVVAGTSGVVEFGGDLLDQKVLQKKEDLDYTHAISNGLWSATTTLVVGGITNEISNVIHPEAKTGTMDYLFGRDKAKAVVKAQYNNARSSSSRAKYWNRLEKIKLQKTLGTIKYGIIETGKTIIDEIKNEIYRDEVNEDIVEEIDKKISCSVY